MYDLLIKGGTVVDGTGAPPTTADVGVVGERIVLLGKAEGGARTVFDANGALPW